MSAQTLITEHLDLWTQAVTQKSTAGRGRSGKIELTGIKKLRELILELAVRGKLLTQDSGDECASTLLDRIKGIEQELIKSKRVTKPKHLASVSSEEVGFTLPSSWQWVRLGTIGQIVGGGTPKSGELSYWSDKGIPWLTPADLYGLKEKYIASGKRDISELGLAKSSAQLLPTGSVLFSSRAPIGYVAITIGDLATNQGFKSCVPYVQEMNQFIYYFLKRSAPYIDASASGTTFKEVSGTKVASIPMPLPPLEEQGRIVQKVDELMALCDRLEQHTSDQLDAHETLVDTLLGTLTQSANATELDDNWARLSEHFDTLFTTEQSINKLKQTILQLAVVGRLVEQDEGGEPVTALLGRISEQKAQLTTSGRKKALSPVNDSEKPFQQPSGWQFKRLGDLAHVFAGNSFKSQDFNNLSGSRVVKITNVGVGELVETRDYLPLKFADEYEKYQVLTGDLILALTRPYISTGLKVAICPDTYNQALLNQRVAAIRPFVDRSFIYIYMQSEYVLGLYQARFGGSGLQPNLKMDDVTNLIIPVPPIGEQHLIVQKVDELMALCDHLKERLNQASDTRCQLAGAVVEGALN